MFVAEISSTRLLGWNKKVLTEADASEFCRSHRITVTVDKRQEYGKLLYYKGYPFILINPALDPGMRLWVLWHEVAHFILHYPETSKFSASMKRKNDREANMVAAVAMMPRPIIEGHTLAEIQHAFGYPLEVVKIRYDIYQREGI